MRKIVQLTLTILMVVMIATPFSPVIATDAGQCSTNMAGGNPQRTNSYQGCVFNSTRIYEEMAYEGIASGYDSFSLVSAYGGKVLIYRRRGEYKEVVCMDINSYETLWSKNINFSSGFTNIVIYGNRIYYLDDDKLVCLDLDNGDELWSSEIPKSVHSLEDWRSLLVCEAGLYIGFRNNTLARYDMKDGELMWEKSIEDPYEKSLYYDGDFSSPPDLGYVNGKIIYYDSGLYCLSPDNGDVIWSNTDENDMGVPLICSCHSNMCLSDSVIIVVRACEFGLVCLDTNSGQILWEFEYFFLLNDFSLSGDTLLGCGETDIKTGESVWKETLGKFSYECHSQFITFDNVSIILNDFRGSRFNGGVFLVDSRKGRVLCSHTKDYYNSIKDYIVIDGYLYLLINDDLIQVKEASDSLTYSINSNTYNPDNDKPREMDSQPTIKNGRTLLPARYVVEPLGGQVFWDGEQRKVTCKLVAPDNPETDEYKENIVELWIDMPNARVNGSVIPIDPDNPEVTPTIINDRTMVPMRFLAESMGCEVEWIAETKEIILTYTP